MNRPEELEDALMKAAVWTKYGPPEVLQLQEVEKPAPKDNEVLIKIVATTVLIGDCMLRGLDIPFWARLPVRLLLGLGRPQRRTILGQELAGVIEAVGRQVTRFKPGDQVLAPTFLRLGSYAEYECLPETLPVLKPAGMTYEDAATLPTGGIYGLHLLREARLKSGERILINGAGGSIGTYALQIAKTLGAEVTAVDSAEKLDLLRALGAEHVIDYTREDFTRSGRTYDVIIDVVGKCSYAGGLRALKPNGRFILGNPGFLDSIRGRLQPGTAGKKVIFESASNKPEDYATLKELLAAGKIKAVIDRRYPLEQIAEAHRYVEQGHKKGSVVITVGQA
jgi:NADPH:quinone reductase-like Zn-dependent oxidoreductase